jgi:hypothetical protein
MFSPKGAVVSQHCLMLFGKLYDGLMMSRKVDEEGWLSYNIGD